MPLNEDTLAYFEGSSTTPVTEKAWAQFWESGSAEWGGDACGCLDDRCIGHHHSIGEPCACLRALMPEFEAAEAEAISLWQRHEIGDPTAVEGVEEWVRQRHDYGLRDWSLDVLVDGEAGIAITSDDNLEWRLLWAAERACGQW